MAGLFGTRQSLPALNQAALRPAAIPSSPFERAPENGAAEATARDLNALVKALGTLNGSLNRYADVRENVRQDPQSQANKEWISKRSQMSFEELRKEAETNTSDGIRIREDAISSLLGEKAYSKFRSDWSEYYNTEFDRQNGDLVGEYEDKRQEIAANLPDEISRSHFYNLTRDHFEHWRDENTKERVEDAAEQVQTAVLDSFRNTIADGKNNGKSAQEIANQLFESSAGNRSFLRFSGAQQNETLFQIATEAAQNGDIDLVKAIVGTARIGAKGEKIPPLKNIASFASKTLSLIDKAQNSKLAKNTEENTRTYIALNEKIADGSLTDDEAVTAQKNGLWTSQQAAANLKQAKNNLLRIKQSAQKEQEKFLAKSTHLRAQDEVVTSTLNALDQVSGATYIGDAEIPNEAGTGTTTISREKRIKMAVDAKEVIFNDETQNLINSGHTPEDAKKITDRRRLAWYANNNIENKTWTDMFNGVASRMTVETLNKNSDTTKVLTQQLVTYHDLKQSNPAYLDKFVTDKKSKEFLEYFDNLITFGQLPVHDAAISAANWAAKDEIEKSESILSTGSADKLTRSILNSQSLDTNTSLNYSMVHKMVETQSRLGVPESGIKDIVTKQLNDDTVAINGVVVRKTKDLPPDFAPLMLNALDEISTKITEERGDIPSSDMIVIPTPNEGMWSVCQKSNPTRILAIITPKTLEDIRQGKIQERNEIIKEKQRLAKADADYVKSQLPVLEEKRAKYVNGENAAINRLRALSKAPNDYYATQADALEHHLSNWIARDNAAALRGHKIVNFFTKTLPNLAQNDLQFNSSAEPAEFKEIKAKQEKNKNTKKIEGIIGVYGDDLNND